MIWRIGIAIILLTYISKTSDAQLDNDLDDEGGLLSPLIHVDPEKLKDDPMETAARTADEVGKLTNMFQAKVYEKIAVLGPDDIKMLFGNSVPPPPESPLDAAVTKRMAEEEKGDNEDEEGGGGLLGRLVGFVSDLLGSSSTDESVEQVQVEESRPKRAGPSLPKEFDSMKKWPECKHIIGMIDDQALCGSCWAISLAHTLSDRYCIASVKAGKGPTNYFLSTTQLMSCVNKRANGCDGGAAPVAWKWVVTNGLVTGGPYGEKNSCQPYSFAPMGAEKAKSHFGQKVHSPECPAQCQKGYTTNFKKEQKQHKATKLGHLAGPGNEEKIMAEVMANGPVQVSIRVYDDLMVYAGGIYQHVTGKMKGGHSVRLTGWGEEEIEGKVYKYWIVANSWNSDWGEDGFFKIIRGVDACNIESFSIDYALPKLK